MTSLVTPVSWAVADEEATAYLTRLAEALLETTRLQQQQFEFLRGVEAHPHPGARAPNRAHRGPTNPLHRTWRGFVEDLQLLEARARREHLKLSGPNVCRFGLDSWRTVRRTFAWYGKDADQDWPPSSLDPNEERTGQNS